MSVLSLEKIFFPGHSQIYFRLILRGHQQVIAFYYSFPIRLVSFLEPFALQDDSPHQDPHLEFLLKVLLHQINPLH
jgi:hypothetical protein